MIPMKRRKPDYDKGKHAWRIDLGHDRFALVDAADLGLVMPYRWGFSPSGSRRTGYAVHVYRAGFGRNASLKKLRMHTLIAGPMLPFGVTVDHKDQNGLNNRRENLRLAQRREQAANQPLRSDNACGFKGVYWDKASSRWGVELHIGGVAVLQRRGTFPSPEAAARVYDEAARKHFGEFACVNFPCKGERGARK